MSNTQVPLLDLTGQYEAIRDEISEAIDRVVRSQYFILGPEVEALESEIATYSQTAHCIGVSSGSDALLVALMALDVRPGDEVITTPYTFFATGGSIARVGARPVFVDIDPVTYNIDPSGIEAKITDCTKAIIPVHLYGQCAEMEPINEIARHYQIPVIEDAAQAIGAEYRGCRAGSLGTVGCFSFFPSKNLGAFGDGGAVTTNDGALAERIRRLRVHGGISKYYHDVVGGNFRLDALQAAVLRVKLRHLDDWTSARQQNASDYSNAFERAGLTRHLVTPPAVVQNRHIYNQYVIRVQDRDILRQHLLDNQVACEIYYPLPLHLQACFKYLGCRLGDYPESELAGQMTLAIPIYPELTDTQKQRVVDVMAEFYASRDQLPIRQAA